MLDDALTVDQHIRYFQAAYQITAANRAEELTGQLGYAASRHQPAGTLSGGTRQKLSLPLVLRHEPALRPGLAAVRRPGRGRGARHAPAV